MAVSEIIDLDLYHKKIKNAFKKQRRTKIIYNMVAKSRQDMRKRSKVPEIIVDNFAGGGGASDGIEQAIGRSIDIAINHDKDAIAMHQANHPNTRHYCEDVYSVDPVKAAAGRPVGLCWFSPDCKHFSIAKGATPVKKEIRGLAWVSLRWASKVRPRVIMLENVPEFESWGHLEAVRDPKTNRVLVNEDVYVHGELTKKKRVARPGEIVPYEKQVFQPKQEKKGKIFKAFTEQYERLGYNLEFKQLRACDFGAPTTRKRLFMIARCDGLPIIWPEPTHAPADSEEVKSGKCLPYRTAAECIDWSIPGNSIFGRKKDLVDNTLRRIARGLKQFILDNPDPFIVEEFRQEKNSQQTDIPKIFTPFIYRIGQTGFAKDGLQYLLSVPLTTITTKAEHCLLLPGLIQMGYGDPKGKRVLNKDMPMGTIPAGGNKFATFCARIEKDLSIFTSDHHKVMMAFLTKCFGGGYNGAGISLDKPTDTITAVDHHCLVTILLSPAFIREVSQNFNDYLINTFAEKSLYRCQNYLSHNIGNSLEVERFLNEYLPQVEDRSVSGDSAFLIKYYGSEVGQDIDTPLHTIPTKDRFGLVVIKGIQYRIVDIYMRMLQPHELAKANGVRDNYIINQDRNGNVLSKGKQIAKIGNMVVPHCSKALVEANLPELCSNEDFAEQVELINEDFENAV